MLVCTQSLHQLNCSTLVYLEGHLSLFGNKFCTDKKHATFLAFLSIKAKLYLFSESCCLHDFGLHRANYLKKKIIIYPSVWWAPQKKTLQFLIAGFKKKANAEVPQNCILSFVQQGMPNMVASRRNIMTQIYIYYTFANLLKLLSWTTSQVKMAVNRPSCPVWSNFE